MPDPWLPCRTDPAIARSQRNQHILDPLSLNSRGKWLVRISEVFADFIPQILAGIGAKTCKRLGCEYFLVDLADPSTLTTAPAARFIRWNMPVHHSWPCNPETMDGFVEKAAQAIYRKFSKEPAQALFAGPLDPGGSGHYYKRLASNLRGRTLQLFPAPLAGFREAEEQNPLRPTLFCMVGKEGLFCGLTTPQAANGFHPGGTRYISQNTSDTISRAGAKIVEALHYLPLFHPLPAADSHWLELGACPGGMTSELLRRGYQVTAIDRAPLDKRLNHQARLEFILADVATFTPPPSIRYDVLLSDMNGPAPDALHQVIRLSHHLTPDGLVIFTLKTPGAASFEEILDLFEHITGMAAEAGLNLLARTHLTYNRLEFTLFFKPTPGRPA